MSVEVALEANKEVMRRYIEEIWIERNYAMIDEIIHPDFFCEPPSFPSAWGIEEFKANVPVFLAAFPDGKWSTEDMVAEGDKVTCIWTFRGTHSEELMGIAPSYKELSFLVIGVYQIADGKIRGCRKLNVGTDFFTAMGLPKPPGYSEG